MTGCTVSCADAAALPPAPVHVSENVLVPTACGETFCDPVAPFAPAQSFSGGDAEAEQESAFVLDQLRVMEFPNVTELADAVSVAVGGGGAPIPLPQPCNRSVTTAKRIPSPKSRRTDFMTTTSIKVFFVTRAGECGSDQQQSCRLERPVLVREREPEVNTSNPRSTSHRLLSGVF